MIADAPGKAPRRRLAGSARRLSEPGRRGWRRGRRGVRPRRRLPGPGRRLPRVGPRALIGVAVVAAVAAGAWLWLRNSSLVAVQRVTITGVSGPDARQIRSSLTSAARTMTTLNVRLSALRTAVAPYPVVKHIHVSTQFPHGMRIRVEEQVPVAEITAGSVRVAVSADGTLLHDAPQTGPLPTITVAVPPGGTHVSGTARADVRLLAAAPYALLAKVQSAAGTPAQGLTVQLRNGPKVLFGDGSALSEKWAALAAVLADASSAGAAYIDVSDPSRPAAGAGSPSGSTAAAGAGPAGSTGSASTGSAAATGSTGSAAAGSAPTGSTGAAATGSTGSAPTGSTGAAATGSTGTGASGPTGGTGG